LSKKADPWVSYTKILMLFVDKLNDSWMNWNKRWRKTNENTLKGSYLFKISWEIQMTNFAEKKDNKGKEWDN